MKRHLLNASLIITAIIFLLIGVKPISVNAADTDIVPYGCDNLAASSLIDYSELVTVSGGYMRVFYDGANARVGVEYYDTSFNIKSRQWIEAELSYWGGFYAGSDAYYFAFGQCNHDEDDTVEVIRVVKYDTSWKRQGVASVTDCDVTEPFNCGCVEFTELEGILYLATGHEAYASSLDGLNHQGLLTISIDEATMTVVGRGGDCHHSFAQYLDNDGDSLYLLEQSEGERCALLTKDKITDSGSSGSCSIFDYGGTRTSAWAIACYASVDGIALSSDNVLTVGTSIDQSLYYEETDDTSRNVYLTVTPKDDISSESTTLIWLTDFCDDGSAFYGLNITKINDNRFMIMWEEWGSEGDTASISDALSNHIVHYIFVDGSGNLLTDEFTAAAPISDCDPIVSGSNIVWYASSQIMVNFYTINTSTGAFSKKVYRVAGETITWKINSKGKLVFTGSGEFSISAYGDAFRCELSSSEDWYYNFYYYDYTYLSDGCWDTVQASVKKMVIKSGITALPEDGFSEFSKLEEVEIEDGLISIGEAAFCGCKALSKITIPYSVTSIGTHALWYTSATIYCYAGSTAETYAKENGISYVLIGTKKGDICNSDGILYRVTKVASDGSGTVKLTSGVNKSKVVVPATVKVNGVSYKVTEIAKNAFKNCKKLTTIKIGKNIKKIGANAFSGCTKLKKVTFGKNVKTIGKKAFYNCKKLKTVKLGNKVTTIGASAFEGCKKLSTLTLGTATKKIGKKAFYKCTSLKSITINSTKLTAKNVKANAFGKTKSSAKVVVPASKKAAYKTLLTKKGISKKAIFTS